MFHYLYYMLTQGDLLDMVMALAALPVSLFMMVLIVCFVLNILVLGYQAVRFVVRKLRGLLWVS